MAIALTGARQPSHWAGGADRGARYDLGDLKGLVEEFLDQAGVRGVVYTRRSESTDLFVESATVMVGGKSLLGQMGWVQPRLAKSHDLRDAVLVAELHLDLLLSRRTPARSFKSLPAFPSARRDVAFVVPEAVTHDAVIQVVRQAKAADLESVELFDLFRGATVPEGHKSVAYAFTYRGADRTLTDAEVASAHAKVVEQLQRLLGAVLRE